MWSNSRGGPPSKISMLVLLLCSEVHAKALVKFLKTAHVPQETAADQFADCVASLTAGNGLSFSDADLTPRGRKHNDALYVSIECRGTTLAHALVDTSSLLNVLTKKALDILDCEGLTMKPSNIVVRDFDGLKRMVHGEVDIPIKVCSQTFESTFHVMDIRPSFSCLLGRPWIHEAGAVTSTLHQMLKFPVKGKIFTLHGEEEYMVSHLNSSRYVEMDGEFIKTPC